jgi:glycine/D-amino acid oxidase-like deaminating enzyme
MRSNRDDTRSYWMKTRPGKEYPRLEGEVEVDVAIVGGGITGITAATLLKRAGLRVAIVEGRSIGEGETGHTTAHLTEAVDGRYRKLIKKHGARAAQLVAASSRAAIEIIGRVCAERSIGGFSRVPGYLYTENAKDVRMLEQELEATRRVGIEATIVHDVPLPSRAVAAIRYENQAQFHPLEYLQALAAAIPGKGSHVYEHTRAVDIHDGRPARVLTENGGVISAHDVIVAANVPLTRLLMQTKMRTIGRTRSA